MPGSTQVLKMDFATEQDAWKKTHIVPKKLWFVTNTTNPSSGGSCWTDFDSQRTKLCLLMDYGLHQRPHMEDRLVHFCASMNSVLLGRNGHFTTLLYHPS